MAIEVIVIQLNIPNELTHFMYLWSIHEFKFENRSETFIDRSTNRYTSYQDMIKRNSAIYESVSDIQPSKRKCIYNDHIFEVSLQFTTNNTGIIETSSSSSIQSSTPPFVFENPYFPINQTHPEPSSFHLAEMFDEFADDVDADDVDKGSRMSNVTTTLTIRNAGTIYSDMAVSPNRENRSYNNSSSSMIGNSRRQNSIRDYFSRDSPNKSIVSSNHHDDDGSTMQIVEPMVGNCTCRVCGKIPAECGTYHNCMHCTRSICVPHCSSVCEQCGMIFCRFCTTINYTLNYERIICPDCN